jgi:hypothetical protein
MMLKTDEELQEMLDKALDMDNFAGMTYQDGIISALEWVMGINDDDPTI